MSNLHQISQDKSVLTAFIERIKKTEYCWEWIGTITTHGYGHFKHKQKVYRAHRVAFVLFKGMIPEGMYVCHACDNPKCVNPDHLWLGTPRDNAMDMVSKGRAVGNKWNHKSGDLHPNTKMTSAMIADIKQLKGKHSQRELSKMFKVSQASIWNAMNIY